MFLILQIVFSWMFALVFTEEQVDTRSVINQVLERINALEARAEIQEHIIQELQSEVSELKRKLAEKDHVNAYLNEIINGTPTSGLVHGKVGEKKIWKNTGRTESSESSTGHRIRRLENEEMVAFSAGLTHTSLHLGPNQNVIFDHVETNIGNGYNPHHGTFVAPVPGIYVFFSSILSNNNGEVWCRFAVNGTNKADIYARGTDTRHDQGSQMIVVKLKQGEDVAVQNMVGDHAVYGDSGIYSTFSGFLLQQEFPVVVG